jgi:hypothetical protein
MVNSHETFVCQLYFEYDVLRYIPHKMSMEFLCWKYCQNLLCERKRIDGIYRIYIRYFLRDLVMTAWLRKVLCHINCVCKKQVFPGTSPDVRCGLKKEELFTSHTRTGSMLEE